MYNLKLKKANFKHIKLPKKQDFGMLAITKIPLRSFFKGIILTQQAKKNDRVKITTPKNMICMKKDNKPNYFSKKRLSNTKEQNSKMKIQS